MRVLLTNPPWHGDTWRGVRAGCRWPFIFDQPKLAENTYGGYYTYPFFMGYAASFLNHMNVGDVFFYDALANKHEYETFYNTVKGISPDITIIETSTPSIVNDLDIASKIKETGSEVALCGPEATFNAKGYIDLPFVDYVLKGEYEANSYEMCLTRRKGIYNCKPLHSVDKLVPVRDQTVYQYADGFGQDQFIKYPQLQMWTSRGCPYSCNFCLWRDTMTYKNYRPRSIKAVMRELTGCMSKFNFGSVLFDDDTVNVGDSRTIELSEAMGSVNIQWHAMVRADACSWNAFEKMKSNGCVGLKIGVETFAQRGLDYLNKGYDHKKLIKTIDFLITSGFKVFMSMMDNIPGETSDEKKFNQDIVKMFTDRGASIQHPNCMPLPGTRLHKKLVKEDKLLIKDTFDYGKFHGETIKA